jgi:hypothetical protein
MARPMLLIPKPLLEQLYYENTEGVPVSVLVRKHSLNITHPTLTKLIACLQYVDKAKPEVKNIMLSSLFPEWLKNASMAETDKPVHKQPSTWRYTGKFPLGKWEVNDWHSE